MSKSWEDQGGEIRESQHYSHGCMLWVVALACAVPWQDVIGTRPTGACPFLPSAGSRPAILAITKLAHAPHPRCAGSEEKTHTTWERQA